MPKSRHALFASLVLLALVSPGVGTTAGSSDCDLLPPGAPMVSDPTCSEPTGPRTCSDGIDNDADGRTDYPSDPNCRSSSGYDESGALPLVGCDDGLDNDLDGLTDYPADPGCSHPSDNSETGTEYWGPTLHPIGNRTTKVGALLQVKLSASHPDPHERLSFGAIGLPEGSDFARSGTFSWHPSQNQTGPFVMTFMVWDQHDRNDTETITITVGPNSAPGLMPIGNRSVSEGEWLEFNVSAFDSDNDTLTYSADGVPVGAWFNVSRSPPSFHWSPSYDQAGTYGIWFRVTDGYDGHASEFVQIFVKEVNRPPRADAGPDQVVAKHSSGSLRGYGSDPDGGNLSREWSFVNSSPAGYFPENFRDDGRGNATFQPPNKSDVELTFAFTVDDGFGPVRDTMTVRVSKP